MSYLLGIDIGSTSLKAVAFDAVGNERASAARPTPLEQQDAGHPTWMVMPPDKIWAGIADATADVVQELGDAGQIAALAVTGMGHDGVPVDADGHWLYPFISWHDNRTLPQHQWWIDHVGAAKIERIIARPLMHVAPVNRIMWLREHEPAVLQKTHKWLLIEDYVNHLLCGERATDYSMAATWQLFDCVRREWSDELLDAAEVDRALLPEARQGGERLGSVHRLAAARTGLKEGTPVVLGGHDYLCGALAATGDDTEVIASITGTWEMTMANVPAVATQELDSRLDFFWDPHVIADRYCFFDAAIAASMTEWFRKQFTAPEDEATGREGGSVWTVLMEKAADVPAGCRGTMFLPHLSGSTFPVGDPGSRAAFAGISEFSTRASFMRAIIEGLNYQSRQMTEELENVIGRKKLRVIGGAVRNAFWMQKRADVLGRDIEVSDIEEATCLGAAIVAGLGVGVYQDPADAFAQTFRPGTVYRPDPAAAETYERLYRDVYLRLYDSLKDIHHQLSQQAG